MFLQTTLPISPELEEWQHFLSSPNVAPQNGLWLKLFLREID
jgi:hypothetical protein